jgi:hypothetical protein
MSGPRWRARLLALALLAALSGCGSSDKHASSPNTCGKGAKAKLKKGARTAGASAKAGVETAAEGVKTFGRATGGLIRGGSKEAKREWNKGASDTDRTASKGADNVSAEARHDDCD